MIVALISSCAQLRSLSLGAADKDAGAVCCDLSGLSDALARHNSLTSVDVTAMRVDDATLCAIAAALPRNRSLLTLMLPSSAKTSEGLAADATIRVVLDRNRSNAAERLQQSPILLTEIADTQAIGIANAERTVGGEGSCVGVTALSMPSRSELFKEVERSAYLEVIPDPRQRRQGRLPPALTPTAFAQPQQVSQKLPDQPLPPLWPTSRPRSPDREDTVSLAPATKPAQLAPHMPVQVAPDVPPVTASPTLRPAVALAAEMLVPTAGPVAAIAESAVHPSRVAPALNAASPATSTGTQRQERAESAASSVTPAAPAFESTGNLRGTFGGALNALSPIDHKAASTIFAGGGPCTSSGDGSCAGDTSSAGAVGAGSGSKSGAAGASRGSSATLTSGLVSYGEIGDPRPADFSAEAELHAGHIFRSTDGKDTANASASSRSAVLADGAPAASALASIRLAAVGGDFGELQLVTDVDTTNASASPPSVQANSSPCPLVASPGAGCSNRGGDSSAAISGAAGGIGGGAVSNALIGLCRTAAGGHASSLRVLSLPAGLSESSFGQSIAPAPSCRQISIHQWQGARERADSSSRKEDPRPVRDRTATATLRRRCSDSSTDASRPQAEGPRLQPGRRGAPCSATKRNGGGAATTSVAKGSKSHTLTPRALTDGAPAEGPGHCIDPFAPSYKVGFDVSASLTDATQSTHAPAASCGSTAMLTTGVVLGSDSPLVNLASDAAGTVGGAAGSAAGGVVVGPFVTAREEVEPFGPRFTVATAELAGGMPENVVVDYHQLVWSDVGRQLPPGVNAAKLEAHLSETEFEQVFGMLRSQFYAMSKVEQMRCKQDVGLF